MMHSWEEEQLREKYMSEQTTLYIPKGARTLDTIHSAQIRLGIQGPPGEGKTFGALTFPNPVVGNIDRGLGAHIGRKDIIEIPFYDAEWCKAQGAKWKSGEAVNRRDAIMTWCRAELPKLVAEQTFIMDASTGLEAAFDIEQSKFPFYTKSGEEDKFVFWREKVNWFQELFEDIFKAIPCNVIYICHEQLERNKQGDLTGKNNPLFTGQFKDKLVSHLTDHFRQHCVDKKPDEKIDDKTLRLWGMSSKDEFKKMQDSFIGNSVYCWQTEGDDIFSAKASSMKPGTPRFIPANYESFMKWRKPIS